MSEDIGTVRWWGLSWGAPINDPRAQIQTPVGEDCADCLKPVEQDQRGISIPSMRATDLPHMEMLDLSYAHYHRHCFMRTIGLWTSLDFS